MIGFVATYIPKTGAVGLAVVGAAGMFAVSIYTQIMGGYYDGLTSNLSEVDAGRAVIRTTLYIPIALIVIFAGIHLYMKQKKKLNYLELESQNAHKISNEPCSSHCAFPSHIYASETLAGMAPSRPFGYKRSVSHWTVSELEWEDLCPWLAEQGIEAIDLVGPENWHHLKKHGLGQLDV